MLKALTTIGLVLGLIAPLTAAQLSYHEVRLDAQHHILPWYAEDPGSSYDHTLKLLWFYWQHIPNYLDIEVGGKRFGAVDLPKYMVFRTLENKGIGGDQFAMLLSSWAAYYQYTGDRALIDNMVYQADAYLAHGLSPANAAWPGIPYPCNTEPSLIYDGDLIFGKGFTQPDKAGSFGAELITLYEITGNSKYLDAATSIADVLASKTKAGDVTHSPIPFKVNALTGEVKSEYTTNWTGTLRLFQALAGMKHGNVAHYLASFKLILAWLKQFPMQNNKWGPFFEDVPGWSDTQINATTLAWYLMDNKSWDPDWKQDVRRIQDWVIQHLGNHSYEEQMGVFTINEQTAYPVPGQSHTSRHASVELRYAAETGDLRNQDMAIRQLNWATYFVDDDGKNRYPDPKTYEIWWTDGYGDFVRHYLRAMAADPELTPADQNHVLASTSVLRDIVYTSGSISYASFDKDSTETIKLVRKPVFVNVGGSPVPESSNLDSTAWSWQPLKTGGLLKIHHTGSQNVAITLALP